MRACFILLMLSWLGSGCTEDPSPIDAAPVDQGMSRDRGSADQYREQNTPTDARPDHASADSAPQCQPQIPPRSDHVDPCLVHHDPLNPAHLSSRQPTPVEVVTLRLEAQAGDVTEVILRVHNGVTREVPMALESSAAGVDIFEVQLAPGARPSYYRFLLKEGAGSLYLTAAGATADPPTGQQDFFLAPVVQGKTLHYKTDFTQPEIRIKSGGSYLTAPLTTELAPWAGISGVGVLGQELLFHLRDQATGAEDHPPGGGDYRLAPDLDEAWLERGALFDVDPRQLDLDLIDCHTHPYNRVNGAFVLDSQPLVTLLPAQGIIKALVMMPGNLSDQRSTLTALHQAHRWVIPLVWVNPAVHVVAEVRDLIEHHGFRGLKFHPTADNFPADSALMDPFMALAQDLHVPVQLHSATDDNALPARIVALAARHPEVTVVMVHTNLGALDKTATIELIKGQPNVYAETSWTNAESILQIMGALDSSRTLFGTDATVDGYEQFTKQSIATPQGQYSVTIPQVISQVRAEAHPDAFANWAYLTTIRLYGWRFLPDGDLYDTDGDGQPDATDSDDDNDGTSDTADAEPLKPDVTS